jgi:hypothetical protein
MEGDIKGFGRPRSKLNCGHDVRERCGRLTLKAKSEVDAALMALVYRSLFGVCVKQPGSRLRLYAFLRNEADGFDEPAELAAYMNRSAKS